VNNIAGKKILVVDDEAGIRDVIKFELELNEAIVYEAENGKVAFEFIKVNPIDFVISDIRMPVCDGHELLKLIKKFNPNVPMLIFVTGYSDLSNEVAFHDGADAVLTKPLDLDQLVKKVNQFLVPTSARLKSRDIRIETKLNVTISFASLNVSIATQALNLGRGGAFFASDGANPQIGEIVSFTITFEDTKFSPISGQGITRWTRQSGADKKLPAGFGLEFTTLSNESLAQYLSYLEQNIVIPFIPRV